MNHELHLLRDALLIMWTIALNFAWPAVATAACALVLTRAASRRKP